MEPAWSERFSSLSVLQMKKPARVAGFFLPALRRAAHLIPRDYRAIASVRRLRALALCRRAKCIDEFVDDTIERRVLVVAQHR
jgi:hypothetical protein